MCTALSWVAIATTCAGGIFLALLGRATVRRRGEDMGGEGSSGG